MAEVSVILPVHNEGRTLEGNVKRLMGTLDRYVGDYEILISEDGSTDGSGGVAKSLRSARVRSFHNCRRVGKGAAIKSAAARASGNIIVFMDADLASEPSHVAELVGLIRGGSDIVIGSRYLPGAKASRSMVRHAASRTFNLLVRLILGSRLSDHQCGFKAFRKDRVLPVVNDVEDDWWFWDTELLVRAQRRGLRIAEMPIEWREVPGSRFRLFHDSLRMASCLVRFRLKH
jgi:glycosyltransferase involved in cell wall biosynthesis